MQATRFLTPEERRAVGEAIGETERRTAAEVICAVATESGRYDRAEACVGLVVALVGLLIANLLSDGSRASGSWEEPGRLPYLLQAVGVAAGFVVGNVLASYAHGVRRLCVGRRELEAEVARAASHVFVTKRLASTRSQGGVLVYVSLFERRVVILADQGAFAVLGQAGVDALRDDAVTKLRAGDRVGTLTDTVAAIGERLAEALPSQGDPGQLSDEVLIYHPRP